MSFLRFLISSFFLIGLASAESPTTLDWDSLNRTVGGRLKIGVPFAQPCFSLLNGGRANVATNTTNVQRSSPDMPITTTGDQCLLDFTNPSNPAAFSPPAQCQQGSVPNFYVDVKNPNDVLAGYAFSKKMKVPLLSKIPDTTTLAEALGRGRWHYGQISLNLLSSQRLLFTTKPTTAITIGAGQQFRTVYDFAAANNVTVIGGSDPSVAFSGGWVMGGGHGALSPALGLGVDRVLEFKIVTPDGHLRVANKCQNEDLFFALRGGGGGTFGVVLESTHIASSPDTGENTVKLIHALAKTAVQFAADGWGGYVTPTNGSGIWANPSSTAMTQRNPQSLSLKPSPLWWECHSICSGNFYGLPIGIPQVIASRLISSEKFKDETLIQGIADAFVEADFSQILAVPPFAFKDFDREGTPLTLFGEKRFGIAIVLTWDFNSTLAQRVDQYQKLTELWSVVREQTPGGGAYVSEADVFEPHFIESFWGQTNYAKLLAIKNKYDPDHLLDCWHCGKVGPTEARHRLKELRPVFGYAINKIWNHDLGWKAVNVMDTHKIYFTTIKPVRFKEIKDDDEEEVGPVVIWVGVHLGSRLASTTAHDTSLVLLTLLKDFGITDVHVHFRESNYARGVGAPLYAPRQ
ncbi:hypothetical protein CPB84DRAFT_1750726 [Gymnopilus junonius]|uniref:FAD-binding PCMH-type domain-containing protein n=1 Tax=Gymnopilus junonius TaxID=109634 RepID=A0A9P5NGB1_GYMJU|nr:hypothetical protein CPB84DRAFT_1750726 [Gymnopilus junonius]